MERMVRRIRRTTPIVDDGEDCRQLANALYRAPRPPHRHCESSRSLVGLMRRSRLLRSPCATRVGPSPPLASGLRTAIANRRVRWVGLMRRLAIAPIPLRSRGALSAARVSASAPPLRIVAFVGSASCADSRLLRSPCATRVGPLSAARVAVRPRTAGTVRDKIGRISGCMPSCAPHAPGVKPARRIREERWHNGRAPRRSAW